LALGQIGYGHLGGFGVDGVWMHANHGADGDIVAVTVRCAASEYHKD
jgi:hypothetical protein